MRTWFTSRNGTVARSIIIALVTGRIALVAVALASPSVGMRVPAGRSQGMGLPDTMDGRWPQTRPTRKCGMPRWRPAPGKPTASTTLRRLLSARSGVQAGKRWRAGCLSRSTPCRMPCSPTLTLLVMCTLASPLVRSGTKPIMAIPGANSTSAWDAFIAPCCSCHKERNTACFIVHFGRRGVSRVSPSCWCVSCT